MESFEREVKPIISSLARGSGESTHLLAATSIRHSGIEQDRYAHHPAHQARTLLGPCLPSFCRCELRAQVGCERGWCCSARKHRNVLPSLLLPSPTCACAVHLLEQRVQAAVNGSSPSANIQQPPQRNLAASTAQPHHSVAILSPTPAPGSPQFTAAPPRQHNTADLAIQVHHSTLAQSSQALHRISNTLRALHKDAQSPLRHPHHHGLLVVPRQHEQPGLVTPR